MVSGPSEGTVEEGRVGPGPIRNVLLLGFMASGKTTVGRRLAERLGWRFTDFDREVEARAGRTVARIFDESGEEAFRTLEGKVGEEWLARPRVVLAAGGGWPTRPGRLEQVPPDTLTVWLRVDPSTAVQRAARHPGTRPLLSGVQDEAVQDEALTRASELIRAREPFYAASRLHLDTAGASPDALVDAIVRFMDDPDAIRDLRSFTPRV
jgi:shikimate kinase